MKYLYAFFGILIIFFIIYGLRSPLQPNYSPDDASLRERRELYEQFANPKNSSDLEVQQGASNFYDWQTRNLHLSDEAYNNYKRCDEGDTECEMNIKNVNVQNDYYIINKKEADCNKCDINRHPELDKYVLKTSVPPCPDISKFALKTDIAAPMMHDMNDYIKKTDIPICEKCPDISNYVLKTNIPANVDCPKCPTCPVCPVCPVCPPTFKNIEDDPKFKRYMANFTKNFDLNKYPQLKEKVVLKSECDARLNKQKEEIYQQIINNSDTIVRDIEKIRSGQRSNSNAGTSGAGANGAGTNGVGPSGVGASGVGPSGVGANGVGPSGVGANGVGASGVGANGAGTNGAGANGAGTNGAGANGAGANGAGTNGAGNKLDSLKSETASIGDSLKSRAGKLWNIITNSGKTEQRPNYESVGSGDKNGPYCDKLQGYNCK